MVRAWRFVLLLLGVLAVLLFVLREELHLLVDPAGYWISRLEREGDPKPVIEGLAEMGPRAEKAIPALVKFVKSRDGEARDMAARALGAIGPAAIPSIQGMLAPDQATLHDPALTALAAMGPAGAPAVEAMLRAYVHDRPNGGGWATIHALRRIGAPGNRVLSALAAGKDPTLAPVARDLLQELCQRSRGQLRWALQNALERKALDLDLERSEVEVKLTPSIRSKLVPGRQDESLDCPEQPDGEEWYAIAPQTAGHLNLDERLVCRRHARKR